MRFDPNISIQISKAFLDDYDKLSAKYDKSKNRRYNGPFKTGKDIFMTSVALGYLNKNSKPLRNPQHELFKTSTLSLEDSAILRALYLKYNDMNFDSNYTDDKIILKQAMEWAEAGFNDLKLMTIGERSLSNLICIVDEIKKTFK